LFVSSWDEELNLTQVGKLYNS